MAFSAPFAHRLADPRVGPTAESPEPPEKEVIGVIGGLTALATRLL
jgi:hypothetical protein